MHSRMKTQYKLKRFAAVVFLRGPSSERGWNTLNNAKVNLMKADILIIPLPNIQNFSVCSCVRADPGCDRHKNRFVRGPSKPNWLKITIFIEKAPWAVSETVRSRWPTKWWNAKKQNVKECLVSNWHCLFFLWQGSPLSGDDVLVRGVTEGQQVRLSCFHTLFTFTVWPSFRWDSGYTSLC